MPPVRSLLCALLFLAAAPCLPAQQAASQPSAPLPAALLSAQKVFIANGGAEPVLARDFSNAGLTNEPYTSVYAALAGWGHWQIVASPAGADLVLVVSADATPDTYSKGVPSYDLDLTVRILDGKTRILLWTLRQPLEGAIRKATFQKNYATCVAGLITQLKQLTLSSPQTP